MCLIWLTATAQVLVCSVNIIVVDLIYTIEPTDNKGFTDCCKRLYVIKFTLIIFSLATSHNFGELTNATTSPIPFIPGQYYHLTAVVTISMLYKN